MAKSTDGGNLTRGTFLEFFDELTSALRLKASSDSAVMTVYKRAEQAGVNRKQLKRAYADSLKAADERESDDARYRLYMTWLSKPVGTQAEMPLPNGEYDGTDQPANGEDTEAVAKHENNAAFESGVAAGAAGNPNANPFDPGTENHQSYSLGWSSGQKQAVEALGGATRRTRPAA